MSQIIAQNAFRVVEGRPVTSSRTVAEYFGKKHSDVVRAIQTIITQKPDLQASRNFAQWSEEVEIGSGAKRSVTCFWMDRKGFSILAMGFTGAKALDFKCAFYDEFERMEQKLHPQCPAHAQLPPPSLSEQQAYAIMSEVAKRAKNCGAHYQTIYRALKARYQVTKYTHIPASAFDDAVAFIRSVDLRVPEIVPADEAECRVPEERFLSDSELLALRKLYSFHCDPYWKDCAVAAFKVLDAAHSRFAGRFYDLINEPVFSLFKVEDILKRNGMMPTTN